jgi:hypothetical protein
MEELMQSSRRNGLVLDGRPLLYKFQVGSRDAVPAGIKEVVRQSDREIDKRHADEARAMGDDRAAVQGRVRPGRVDTGEAIYQNEPGVHIASVRSLLALRRYGLVDIHFYMKPGFGKHGRDTAMIVMRLEVAGERIKLPYATIEGLRRLARENRWTLNIWENFDNATINFTRRTQEKAIQMLVMRDGCLRLVEIDENDPRLLEREEDALVGQELLDEVAEIRATANL